jgi:hypothetical protein
VGDTHTQGPWRIVDDGKSLYTFLVGANDIALGQIHRKANARLIASSPDLFAALKQADRYFDALANSYEFCEHMQDLADTVKAALSKAEGAN